MKMAYSSDLGSMMLNPLDVLEQMVAANDWPYERFGDEEITTAVTGSWCEYHLRFYWREEGQVLQVAATFDFRIPDNKKSEIYETLARINERLWIGHFELWSDQGSLMYRHAVLVDEETGGISERHCETLVENSIAECERFYPVFQFVIWAGKSPVDAIEAALLETVGEA